MSLTRSWLIQHICQDCHNTIVTNMRSKLTFAVPILTHHRLNFMARISCSAGYHRTMPLHVSSSLSCQPLCCTVMSGQVKRFHLIHFSLPCFEAVGCDVICLMQSLSRDWICDAQMAWGWFDTASAMEEEAYTWEVTMQDICRRGQDESEGQLSLKVTQKVLQRTFTAFVKAKGDHWLLGLLDMLFFDLNLSMYLIMWLLASWWSVLNQGFSICHQCWTLLLPKDV